MGGAWLSLNPNKGKQCLCDHFPLPTPIGKCCWGLPSLPLLLQQSLKRLPCTESSPPSLHLLFPGWWERTGVWFQKTSINKLFYLKKVCQLFTSTSIILSFDFLPYFRGIIMIISSLCSCKDYMRWGVWKLLIRAKALFICYWIFFFFFFTRVISRT